MTLEQPKCPACGKDTFKAGMHCVKCLEAYMRTMTPSDWQRALSGVVDEIVSVAGEVDRSA